MKQLISCLIISVLILMPLSLYSQNKRDIIEVEGGGEEFRSERLAIIAGVEKYIDNKIPNLEYSVDDANFLKSVLETQGNFTINYIADDSPVSPTKENIMKSFDDVIELQKINMEVKTLVFYFAGHGFNVSGTNYLAPTETDFDDITGTAINLDDILSKIKTIKKNGTKVMIFLDACRNDPTLDENTRSMPSDPWKDSESQGLKIMYSTSEGNYSYEMDGHGVFTLYLVGGLLGVADKKMYGGNEDNFVSFEEASKYVSIKMRDWSNKTGFAQTPRIEIQDAMGDFFISVVDEMAFSPPNYMSQPEIAEIGLNGVKITWETDKETISNLYIDSKSDFSITDDTASFYDLSTDGKNHYVILNYDEIDPNGEYYFRSVDKDFIDNEIASKEIHIPKEHLYRELEELYKSESNQLYAILKVYVNGKDYASATQTSKDIVKLIEKYEGAIGLEELKTQMVGLMEAMTHLKHGDDALNLNDYQTALENYKKSAEIIVEKGVGKFIPKEQVEEDIDKLKAIVLAYELLEDADRYVEEEKHKKASYKYDECLRLIKRRGIEDMISVEDIEKKMKELPKLLSRFYVNLGLHLFSNLTPLQKNGDSFTYTLPGIRASFGVTIFKWLGVGLGIDLANIELYANLSIINKSGRLLSPEIYIRLSFLTRYTKRPEDTFPTSVGFKLTGGYSLILSEYLGWYIELGIWTDVNLVNMESENKYIPVNLFLGSGIVINI